MQVVIPERLHEYVPTVHDRHAVPLALLFVPFGHISQTFALPSDAYLPGPHAVQMVDSSDDAYSPGRHDLHIDD